MQRPYQSPGIGWLLAVVVVVISILALLVHVAIDPWWAILALALAILL